MDIELDMTVKDVEYLGVSYPTLSHDFWTIVPAGKDINNPLSLGMLMHNVKLGGGLVIAITKLPGGKNMRALRSNSSEPDFERVRAESYDLKPSRLECYYLSHTRELAEQRRANWFRGKYEIIRCNIVLAQAKIHCADVSLYEDYEDTKDELLIHRYWKGEIASPDNMEVLADSALHFPDWQNFETIWPEQ